MFASLRFWKYYFQAEGIGRDQKLEKVYKDLIPSHLALLVILLIPMALLQNKIDDETLQSIFIISAMGIAFQLFFQIKTCYQAIKRTLGIDSFRAEMKEGIKEFAVLSGGLAVGLTVSLVEGFKDIIDEFYGDYREKDDDNEEPKYQNEYDRESENQDQYHSDRLEKIYKKYNIPHDANFNFIKKRFRSLAKEYHPDMPNGNEKLFIELREDMYFLMDFVKENESA